MCRDGKELVDKRAVLEVHGERLCMGVECKTKCVTECTAWIDRRIAESGPRQRRRGLDYEFGRKVPDHGKGLLATVRSY